MNYKHHAVACIITTTILSITGLATHHLTAETLVYFWAGVIPYTFVITCDLDSASSVVTKFFGPFNIFSPFADFGHREVLHHYAWGPMILIGWWLIPALWAGYAVHIETIAGAVLMLWCHMSMDVLYSGTKRIVPKCLVKGVKYVIRGIKRVC
jgi:uncharacterized metal-binding protein